MATKTTTTPRTFVFIDGDNLVMSAKNLGFKIDLAMVRSVLQRRFGPIGWMTYYGSTVPPAGMRSGRNLSELGYQEYIRRAFKNRVDTQIFTDAMSLLQDYDTIALVSGDGDFIPLLEKLKWQGKRTIVISLRIANRELINVAAEYFSLEDLLSETALPLKATQNIKEDKSSQFLPSNRSLRVFLCHSSSDKQIIRDLYRRLTLENNISPWLDEKDIMPGQDWDYEINTAIRESDVVIVCCSKSSVNKEGYVQKEIVRALDIADEKPQGTIFIIPVKLDECEIPRRLGRWHWVNYFDDDGYRQLMRSLRHRAEKLGL